MSELADLLERFRRGAELVAVATTGAAGPVLDFQPAPGKWGVRTIVCHLADTETVLAMRLRQVIAEENPLMPAMNQDLWAERLHYSDGDPAEALERFSALRRATMRLLDRATPDDLERVGVHTERGEESLGHLRRLYAGHDLLHLRQIARVRSVVAGAK